MRREGVAVKLVGDAQAGHDDGAGGNELAPGVRARRAPE
jgi:hypothetical protein